MREKLLKLSLISVVVSAVSFVIDYFIFHFVTDAGVCLVWQPEPGKPFVAEMVGIFATLWFFAAAFILTVALVFTEKENRKEDK